MNIGQVWRKGNFDGLNETGHLGGRGSSLAVTAQNYGADGLWGTGDDVLAPLNRDPVDVAIDWTVDNNCADLLDRVRGFYSMHPTGANFVFGDGSVRFISHTTNPTVYRALSTMNGREIAFLPY